MHLNGTQWVARFRFAAFPLDNSSARSDCDGDDDGGLTTALLKARVDWHAWHAHAQPKVTRRHERGKASAHFLSVYRQRLLLGYFCCCMQLASISGAFIKSQRHKERVTATVFTLDTTWRCSVPPRLEAACTAFLPLRLKRNSCQGGKGAVQGASLLGFCLGLLASCHSTATASASLCLARSQTALGGNCFFFPFLQRLLLLLSF